MCDHYNKNYSRRDFLNRTSLGLGALALGSLIDPLGVKAATPDHGGILGKPHFAPKAKRVIYFKAADRLKWICLITNRC